MVIIVLFATRPEFWTILIIVILFAAAMFTNAKFVHPVRTQRWRLVTLPMAIAWTFFAGWAAYVDFHPESWAHWGLIITSVYLAVAGVLQQLIPAKPGTPITR